MAWLRKLVGKEEIRTPCLVEITFLHAEGLPQGTVAARCALLDTVGGSKQHEGPISAPVDAASGSSGDLQHSAAWRAPRNK